MSVVSAHPHYPEPSWGTRVRPYREKRDGIPVYRLPIWPGRDSGIERIRQDLSSAAAGNLAAPFMPPADAVIAVSPSLPGLSAAMTYSFIRRVPWILWLQDIVTDGAVTTGELSSDHSAIRIARAFEKRAYCSAAHIVVISGAFRARLIEQGVPEEKISLVYNPMTRNPSPPSFTERRLSSPPRILAMGNVGRTQGLEAVVEAFQADPALAEIDAEMLIAGSGVALESVRARVSSARVLTPGVVDSGTLDDLLESSHLGLVSQRAGLREFNLPSKLMNYMAFGVPVLASVDAESLSSPLHAVASSATAARPNSLDFIVYLHAPGLPEERESRPGSADCLVRRWVSAWSRWAESRRRAR